MDEGVIAIIVALLSGAVAVGSTVYTKSVDARVSAQERAETKAETLDALMSRYREPLVQTAFDLQSRIWNIIEGEFLQTYYFSERREQGDYARDNTLYVFAEYLGWSEILRREVQFLDLGDEQRNREWNKLRDAVRRTLLTDDHPPPFRVFNGQQRAIGELMLCPSSDANGRQACLGYAAFTQRLQKPEFATWFAGLREDLDLIAREPEVHEDRLRALQAALMDLIDFLDPSGARLPIRDLQRLEPTRPAPRSTDSGGPHGPSPGDRTPRQQLGHRG
jgi:hypothetical protein